MSDAQLERPLKILLVEDNDDDADWTIEALAKEGMRCHVSRVGDGEEALAYLRREGKHSGASFPSLILLDLSLPKKSGLELLREIRGGNDSALQKLPVVIMTISKEFGDVQEAANLRVNGYISKPVKLEGFIAAVKAIAPDPELPDKDRDFLTEWAKEMGRFA